MTRLLRFANTALKALLLPLALFAGAVFLSRYGGEIGQDSLIRYGTQIRDYYDRHPATAFALFTAAVTLGIGSALPLMQLAPIIAGFCFGYLGGVLSSLIFYTIGPVLTFLLARYCIGATVQRKYAAQLHSLNRGFARDGLWYMLILRHIPLPFFAVNLCMGLTSLTAARYAWINMISLAPGALTGPYFGAQLAKVDQASDFFTPEFITAIALFILSPILLAKFMHRYVKSRRKNTNDTKSRD